MLIKPVCVTAFTQHCPGCAQLLSLWEALAACPEHMGCTHLSHSSDQSPPFHSRTTGKKDLFQHYSLLHTALTSSGTSQAPDLDWSRFVGWWFSRVESPGNTPSLWITLQQFLCCHLLTQLVAAQLQEPRAHVLHSNSGTMWHLEIPCPELLLCVWEPIPQTGIEGSLAARAATVSRKE